MNISESDSPWVIWVSTDPEWGVEERAGEWRWWVTDGNTEVSGFAATQGAAERRVEAELEWWT